MYLDCLQAHLAVCAQVDVPRMVKFDPGFWNLVSIREPSRNRIDGRGLKRIHTLFCFDVVGLEGLDENLTAGIPRREHVEAVFAFADELKGQPLLVHCWAGVSRSTAIALLIMIRAMHRNGDSVADIAAEAPDLLLEIRPQAAPNPLILQLGLETFMTGGEARDLVVTLLNHPGLFANFHHGASPS